MSYNYTHAPHNNTYSNTPPAPTWYPHTHTHAHTTHTQQVHTLSLSVPLTHTHSIRHRKGPVSGLVSVYHWPERSLGVPLPTSTLRETTVQSFSLLFTLSLFSLQFLFLSQISQISLTSSFSLVLSLWFILSFSLSLAQLSLPITDHVKNRFP